MFRQLCYRMKLVWESGIAVACLAVIAAVYAIVFASMWLMPWNHKDWSKNEDGAP